jgi:hypothetical protein
VLIDNIGFDPRPPRDVDIKEKDVKVFHTAWGKNAEWYMPTRIRAECMHTGALACVCACKHACREERAAASGIATPRWRRDSETPLPSGPRMSSTARGQSDGSTRLSKTLSM